MGSGLRDKTLSVVSLGGIGKRLIEMLRAFGMNEPLAFDPFVSAEGARKSGARLVWLKELLREADFVSVNCPLTASTRDLIGKEQLALMKPTSYLINTARGGIVNEAALIETLSEKRIAGAATDVFESEPVAEDSPLLHLDNVLLAPHCIAWTDELFRDIGHMACESALTVLRGEIPPGVVNREVLARDGFR
jgi:phosphoglycerate dehydrogenase-like enzyme